MSWCHDPDGPSNKFVSAKVSMTILGPTITGAVVNLGSAMFDGLAIIFEIAVVLSYYLFSIYNRDALFNIYNLL